jgi:hypothetical protein
MDIKEIWWVVMDCIHLDHDKEKLHVLVNMLQQNNKFLDQLQSHWLLKNVPALCSLLSQNPSHVPILNNMLPFRAHFPTRYQFNASHFPVCSYGTSTQILGTRLSQQPN